MKKWMIITIVIVYSVLIGLIIYYGTENGRRKNKLEDKVNLLESKLNDYYKTKYNSEDLGKIFIFPGETNIEFDASDIMSGEAFIYSNGEVEIALYDGKFCAYKKGELKITKTSINECITNR